MPLTCGFVRRSGRAGDRLGIEGDSKKAVPTGLGAPVGTKKKGGPPRRGGGGGPRGGPPAPGGWVERAGVLGYLRLLASRRSARASAQPSRTQQR
jgi:hypothetical protein